MSSNPLQDLEDFANGQGAGAPYSAQQGSGLPIVTAPTRQGGLSLDAGGPSSAAVPEDRPSFGPSLPAMPMPTGTPPGMPPGLPIAPPPPPPLPGQLGQLGGEPMSLPQMLQQALMQMNAPRPWGRTEGIGNILQSIGAGFMGQRPNWQTQEESELERRQKALQLGLTMRQLDQQDVFQKAQIGHMNTQNSLVRAQAYEHGAKVLDWLGERLDDKDLTPEQRQRLIDSASPMLSDMFAAGAQGDPNKEALAKDPDFIRTLLQGGSSKAKNFLAGYPLLDANGQRVVGALVRVGKYDEAIKTAKSLSDDSAANIVNGIIPQWQRVIDANPKLHQALSSGNVRVTLDDALDAVRANPQQRHAVDVWLRNQKPDYVDAMLGKAGIQSPFAEAERQKEFNKSQAGALGSESTPGGRAKIEGTLANTRKTNVETQLLPIKTVPGQGGMLVDVGVPGQLGAPAAPSNGVNVGPVPQTPTTQGVQPPGGVSLTPGARVIARTPLPGMTPEAARDIRQQESVSRNLRLLDQIVKTGDVNNYIGPALTGARGYEWWQKNMPAMLAGGKVPDAFAIMDSAEANLKNLRIRDITGAAVRESEEPRILAEVPDRTRDKPEIYRAKLRYQMQVQDIIERRTKELLGPDGRMRVDVDANDIARRHPLPIYGDPSTSGQVIDPNQIRVNGDFKR